MKTNYIIFSDKDGTLSITHSTNNILAYSGKNNCLFVVVSGRTSSDTNEIFKNASVGIPLYTIGDNGAIVYDNKNHIALQKINLPNSSITGILNNFFEFGGKPQDIRYTNGENIFTLDNKLNHTYYKDSSTVKFIHNISDISDITKITLAGSKKLMEKMSEIATTLDCSSDIGKTSFPSKIFQNYRLDIQDKKATKGNAVKFLTNYLGIQNFACFGNGWNDYSMFQEALKTGNCAFVMSNAPQDLIIKLHNYIKTLDKKSRGSLNMVYDDDSTKTIFKYIQDYIASQKNFSNKLKVGFTPEPLPPDNTTNISWKSRNRKGHSH